VRRARSGFTLAEVAVTIVIVGIGLTLILQGLNASQLTATHTRNMRLARELALRTLGEISSGLWWEDIESTSDGVYEDYPDFSWEVALGDEPFVNDDLDEDATDTWAERDRLRKERDDRAREKAAEEGKSEDDTEPQEAYEKVKVRVRFPKMQELPDHLDLELWVPWEQVYGPTEESEAAAKEAKDSPAPGAEEKKK
jgi:prepilin-type N-terminal cleavage/methylation domain-containing protein